MSTRPPQSATRSTSPSTACTLNTIFANDGSMSVVRLTRYTVRRASRTRMSPSNSSLKVRLRYTESQAMCPLVRGIRTGRSPREITFLLQASPPGLDGLGVLYRPQNRYIPHFVVLSTRARLVSHAYPWIPDHLNHRHRCRRPGNSSYCISMDEQA